jgi:hypothetical protein
MPVTITVNAETQAAAARIAEFFRGTGEGLERLSGASEFLKEWGQRIATAFTVGALVEFTREMINAAENLKILNEQGGFSVKMLSSLREASGKTREGFEGVSQALLFFSRALGEAERNGGEVRQAFRQLIGSQELVDFANGQVTIDKVLRDTVVALNRIEDPAKRAALASEIFSRGWRDALAAVGRWKSDAPEGPITKEMADNADEFNTKVRELVLKLHDVGIELADKILPSLIKFVGLLKQMTERFEVLKPLITAVAFAINGVLFNWTLQITMANLFIGTLVDGFKLVREAIVAMAETSVDAATIMATALSGQPIEALKMLTLLVSNLKKDSGKALTEFYDQQSKRAKQAMEILRMAAGGSPGAASAAGGAAEVPGPVQGPFKPQVVKDAEAFAKEIDKAFAEAVNGRKALLKQEEADTLDKLKNLMEGQFGYEDEITKVKATFAAKRRQLEQQEADAEIQIELAKVQGRRHLLEQDPTQTENEKKAKLLGMLKEEHDLLEKNIALYQRLVADSSLNPEAKIAANKQLQDLQQRSAENTQSQITVGGRGNFGFEFQRSLKESIDAMGTFAGNIADTIKNTIGTAVSSVASGIAGWVVGTKRWSDALREIGTGVLTTLTQGFIESLEKMVVSWIQTHVLMKVVSALFRTGETTANTAHQATQVGIHTAGETTKTGVTLGQSIARGAIRLAETVFHGIQVAIRTAAHIAGEIAATAASLAQSAIRMGAIIVEAIWWLIKAAFQGASAVADIPYVGPILAIAAIAAILGVGAAAIAGAFKEGGFTGSGSDDDVAGVVHANEYVFSAPAVRSIGVENLDALHNGRSLAAAPAGPAARRGGRAGDRPVEIHVNNFSDMSAVNKHIRQNTDAHHAIVEVMRNNWHLISAR